MSGGDSQINRWLHHSNRRGLDNDRLRINDLWRRVGVAQHYLPVKAGLANGDGYRACKGSHGAS